MNPANYRAWYQLGLIESKTDKDAAIADYKKAVSIQGALPHLRRDLGLLYFQRQDYAEAAEHLAKAAELGMNDAPLYNFLGIAYGHTNRLARAVESYKRAIELDANLAEAHLNLAFAYQRLNQIKAAQQEYALACKIEQKFCQIAPHPVIVSHRGSSIAGMGLRAPPSSFCRTSRALGSERILRESIQKCSEFGNSLSFSFCCTYRFTSARWALDMMGSSSRHLFRAISASFGRPLRA